jgi:HAE1 family hydrophobic/amphiphilic exporter-1
MVTLDGFSTHELHIQIRPQVLGQYQLSVEEVANLICQQSIDMPAGVVKSTNKDYQIRFENSRSTVAGLAVLVITNSELGGKYDLEILRQ